MVGRLGAPSLAAIAIAGLFSGILFTFVWPVLIGTQAIASRLFGKQQISVGVKEGLQLAPETGNSLDNGIVVGISMGFFGIRGAAMGTVLAGFFQLSFLICVICFNKSLLIYNTLKFKNLDSIVMRNMV